jgi:hypothetical protein
MYMYRRTGEEPEETDEGTSNFSAFLVAPTTIFFRHSGLWLDILLDFYFFFHHHLLTISSSDLINGCIKQVYGVLGKANVTESRQQLEELARQYNYSSDAVVNHIMNSYGTGADGEGEDDGMFGLELGSAVKPPPGFSGPPQNAPITKGKDTSAMAQHLLQHPAEKGAAANGTFKKAAAISLDALTRASTASENLPADVIPFDFSEPSPDDLVMDKQKQAFKKGGSGAPSPASAKTGPLFTSGSGPKGQNIKVSGGPAKVTKLTSGAIAASRSCFVFLTSVPGVPFSYRYAIIARLRRDR